MGSIVTAGSVVRVPLHEVLVIPLGEAAGIRRRKSPANVGQPEPGRDVGSAEGLRLGVLVVAADGRAAGVGEPVDGGIGHDEARRRARLSPMASEVKLRVPPEQSDR